MKGWILAGAAAGGLLAGCRTPGWDERLADAGRLRDSWHEETEAYFATNTAPLTLGRTLVLARERTLKLTQERLDRQVAGIQRATAFSSFLPQVEATFSRQGTDVPLVRSFGDMKVSMSDQYLSGAGLMLTQPLFTPQAWLLYVEARRQVRAQDLALARAQELLDVQVATLFYQTAVADEMLKTYERQREATQSLAEQIAALAKEGYALAAEQARVEARLASDAFRLREARDTLALTRARLFEILRFWPVSDVKVDGASMMAVLERDWALTAPDGTVERVPPVDVKGLAVEELLWQTLLNRKELWIGDQMVDVRKTEVVRALTGFLPELYGSAGGQYSSESLQTPARYWAGGLSAVLSVFNGFQTLNAYREAKARREAEFLLQEDRALALLVSVFEAHQNWAQSFEWREVARKVMAAAELDYRTAEARYKEDQETMSEVLDKLADMETARVQAVSAEYACALAEIVLRDAVGVGLHVPERLEREAAEEFRGEALLKDLIMPY